MELLLQALERAASSGLMPQGSSVLLAVSGGADSMALLYGTAELSPRTAWTLAVGHVHHGWRGRDADRDLAFVASHAQRLGLSFFSRRVDARRESRRLKLSPESGARHVRYAALADMASQAEIACIATAHQSDDRLESHLIARERRAGLSRLAGPRRIRADGIVRPLLDVSRAEILQFLRNRGVSHRRDASNGNLRLTRNRLRRDLARRRAEQGDAALEELARCVDRLERVRIEIEREFGQRIAPRISVASCSVTADARALQTAAPEIARRAIEEVARPFAAPGRAPLTGPEREEIRRRLAGGNDFRFEAGRRIRFERRGSLLTVRPRRPVAGESV
jgi:tRNA(Ile)-lysidine synthase